MYHVHHGTPNRFLFTMSAVLLVLETPVRYWSVSILWRGVIVTVFPVVSRLAQTATSAS